MPSSKKHSRALESLLGGYPKASALRKAMAILAKSGQQRAAVQVDAIIGNREIVVKPIGPQLARLAGVTGATIMGSGQIVLIMNPVQLLFRDVATVNVEDMEGVVTALNAPEAAPVLAFEAPSPGASSTEAASQATDSIEIPTAQTLAQTIAKSDADEPVSTAVVMANVAPLVMVVDDSLTVRKID